jgi:hypothetical protein
VRASIILFAAGELLALVGIGLWSIPLALVLAGVQCVALALFREQRAARPAAKKPKDHKSGHRAQSMRRFVDRKRPKFKLIRGAA